MAKIDLNAVLDGHDSPRVGDKYEVAPGKWGTMPPPTGKVRDMYWEMMQEDAEVLDAHDPESNEEPELPHGDLGITRALLKDLPSFDDDDAIEGMAAKVVADFFTMSVRTKEKLLPGSPQ